MDAEVRLERLRPEGVEAALGRANVAWLPMGALEFHAGHLPLWVKPKSDRTRSRSAGSRRLTMSGSTSLRRANAEDGPRSPTQSS